MKTIQSINPSTEEILGEVEVSTDQEIRDAVIKANKTKEGWRSIGVVERVTYIRKVYSALRNRANEIAETITREVGTPITECKGEVAWDWGYFEWFLNNVEQSIAPEITFEDAGSKHTVFYEPLGTVAVITPWNLPFDFFIWGVVPNLLVGNTVIHKASEECILSGKLFADIVSGVGLPDGVFSAVHGDGEQGAMLVEQDVDLIWFTGSSEVGKKLYQTAAKKFIRATLEMGGSNPAIVFDDYPVDDLLERIIFKRFAYCAQTCDAVKRLIVHESKFEEMVEKLSARIGKIVVGDPMDSKTQMGPLVSKVQHQLLAGQVADATAKGAKAISGGQVLQEKGYYYSPTLLTHVTKDMRVWNEEVFGPVLPVVSFQSEDEAIALANDTRYGLGSQVFSKDLDRAYRIAGAIKAGNADINGGGHFQPYNPFGGYKESGIGREHGKYGFHELCQTKIVSLKK